MIRSRCLTLIAVFIGLIGLLAGCSRGGDSPTVKGTGTSAEASAAPESIAVALEKPVDYSACREVLDRYSAGIGDARQRKLDGAISAAKPVWAAAPFSLAAADLAFLEAPDFAPADALYLEECAFLRDVEKGLRLRSLPPAERAYRAFEWICQHIPLQNRRDLPPLAVPAETSLLCGTGLPWDRTFAFLALLRQLDLDAFVVGPPEVGTLPLITPTAQNSVRIAPIWAVGVRVEKSLLLIDLDGDAATPGEAGSAKYWNDLKTDDAFVKKTAAVKRAFALTEDQVRNSRPFFCPPLSALAPRFRVVEAELKGEIRLAVDAVEMAKRLNDAGIPWSFWGPANDPASFVHLHRFYAANPELLKEMQKQVVPWEGFPPVFRTLQAPQARDSLRLYFAKAFIKLHFPVDGAEGEAVIAGLYRGSIREATVNLLKIKEAAEADRQSIGRDPNLEAEVAQWCESANAAFAANSRAQRGTDQLAKANAQANLESVTHNALKPMTLIHRAIAGLTAKQALYYIAQGANEKAFRLRIRSLADPARVKPAELAEAWGDAADLWSRYLNYSVGSAESRNAAREKHAQGLLDIARARAAAK